MTTATHPTVPESPATLAIQIDQLKNGIRHVVMFPKGTAVPGKARDIGMREIVTGGNKFWHNPEKIKAGDIAKAAKNNTLPDILGHDGYGAPDKSELKESPIAVVAETAAGTPAQDIATDPKHLSAAIKGAERVKPVGGKVKVTTPGKVIEKRLKVVDPNRQKQDAMKGITRLAASGDIHNAIKTGMQHVASGLLKAEHVDRAMDLGGEPAIKAAISAVPHIHQALQLFHSAKPEHQAIMRPILTARIHSMESRSPQEQAAEIEHLKQHGLLPQERTQ